MPTPSSSPPTKGPSQSSNVEASPEAPTTTTTTATSDPLPTPLSTPIPATLKLITSLQPSSPSRAWLTAPHPTLPLIATAHADKTVRVYSLTSYTHLSTISGGHKRSVRTVAWKPNLRGGEKVIVTGSFDASVGVWRRWDVDPLGDGDEGKLEMEVDTKTNGKNNSTNWNDQAEGDKPNENDFTKDSKQNEDEEDDDEWRFALVLDGHESEVKSVAWSAGGNLLATCSRDKSVWIWEEVGEDDYETVAVLQEHEGDVKCVAWHPEEGILASASYDDEIRLWREEIDDWGCVAVIKGHESTVWCVCWEGVDVRVRGPEGGEIVPSNGNDVEDDGWKKWMERRKASGPRLLSSSEDGTIKVWRCVPRERIQQSRLSIIKSGSNEEEWIEEATLPGIHTRGVYAVAWSQSGRVVSTGGDGLVVVYEERRVPLVDSTTWVVVAQVDAAHGVFEINHATWAKRRLKPQDIGSNGTRDIECIVTTGDDGSVKVWDLPP